MTFGQSSKPEVHTLMTGIVFGESPRWGDDERLWLADWGTQEIIAVDLNGKSDVMVRLHFPSFQPICFELQTIDLEPGCFACMLGGEDARALFMVVREWRGLESTGDRARTGQVLTFQAHAPGAGWP